MGSNGLTMARHEMLSRIYAEKYPESYDNVHLMDLAYTGPHELLDTIPELKMNVGKALLSPTRTYAPIVRKILDRFRTSISAIVHNTGGGQTKCLHFGEGIHYIKNDLFPTPVLFRMIQEASNASWKEMYQVFNMGHRLEILCDESLAKEIIQIAKEYKVEARIIGHCEQARMKNKLTIQSEYGEYTYMV